MSRIVRTCKVWSSVLSGKYISSRSVNSFNINLNLGIEHPNNKLLQLTGLNTDHPVVNGINQTLSFHPLVVADTVDKLSNDRILGLSNLQLGQLLDQYQLPQLSQFVADYKLTGINLAYGVESVQDLTSMGLDIIQARTLFKLVTIWKTTGVPEIIEPPTEAPPAALKINSISEMEELLSKHAINDHSTDTEQISQHNDHLTSLPNTHTAVNKRPEMKWQAELDAVYTSARWGNSVSSLQLILHAAETDPLAQAYLGILYDKGCNGLPKHRSNAIYYAKLALPWLLEQAVAGNAFAQYNLGFCYSDGRGVPQDDHKAAQLYELACMQGHQGAGINLAISHELGEGVKRNAVLASEYFQFYADLKHPHALLCLGGNYQRGVGVKQSDERAVHFFAQAAALGHADAQYSLGMCLLEGRGVAQDALAAEENLKLAASQGHNGALSVLGNPHFRGVGTFN